MTSAGLGWRGVTDQRSSARYPLIALRTLAAICVVCYTFSFMLCFLCVPRRIIWLTCLGPGLYLNICEGNAKKLFSQMNCHFPIQCPSPELGITAPVRLSHTYHGPIKVHSILSLPPPQQTPFLSPSLPSSLPPSHSLCSGGRDGWHQCSDKLGR